MRGQGCLDAWFDDAPIYKRLIREMVRATPAERLAVSEVAGRLAEGDFLGRLLDGDQGGLVCLHRPGETDKA